jgi:hypothetical protein
MPNERDNKPVLMDCSDLPKLGQIAGTASPTIQNFTKALGGMLLALSRISPLDRNRLLPNTLEVASTLDHQLRTYGRVSIKAGQLQRVLVEIQDKADLETITALSACIERRIQYEIGDTDGAAQSSKNSSLPFAPSSMPPASADATRPADSVLTEMLHQRRTALQATLQKKRAETPKLVTGA